MSDEKAALDAKAWLDRLSLMSRSSTCDIHPTEARQMFEVFTPLLEKAEKLDNLLNVAKNLGARGLAIQPSIQVTGK